VSKAPSLLDSWEGPSGHLVIALCQDRIGPLELENGVRQLKGAEGIVPTPSAGAAEASGFACRMLGGFHLWRLPTTQLSKVPGN